MKSFSRLLLKIVTGAVPVFIAACYGPAYAPRRVRAVDSITRKGIPGLQVTCFNGPAQAAATEPLTTDADGTVYAQYCEKVVMTDVDGPANGGPYGSKEVATPRGAGEILVPLEPGK